MWMHLPITDSIWSLPFDGKEQKLGAGYLVTATERGNNRAGESLVEFALKNNDAGVKVYRTAAEYCDRAIASATDSYLRTQYVQKRVCLNISSDSTGLETIMYIWQRYFRQ